MTTPIGPEGPGDDEGDDGPCVCHGCIGEPYLKSEVRRKGTVHTCSYCDESNRRCVTIDWLADRVDPIYRAVVGTAEEMPEISEDDDHVRWIANGESPGAVMTDLIDCADTDIAEALIANLGEKHGYDIFDGDFDYYDESSEIYEIILPKDDRYRDSWDKFCKSLKHERRFFSEDSRQILDEILGPVLQGKRSQFGVAIRTIGPDDDGRFIYRGRLANNESGHHTICGSPIRQMGAPSPALCAAGRMNTAGIPVFYGSSDPETCVAELRAPVGGVALVAKFEIIRPLRLLDLTQLERVQNKLSYFHPRFLQDHGYGTFVRGFHYDIKRPVIPGNEALEYLPTQVVAEYLWTRGARRVDGLIYGSSQVSGDHINMVLFPGACAVEGAENEQVRTVTHSFLAGGDEDGDDVTDEVSLAPLTEPQEALPAVAFDDAEDWGGATIGLEEPEPQPGPALRMVGGLQRVSVSAINYEVYTVPVNLREYRPLKF